MDPGLAIVGVGVLISGFAYLEVIRRDLKSAVSETKDDIRDVRTDVKEVRQASESSHRNILGNLGGMQTQLATLSERVECIDDKVDTMQRRMDDGLA